MRLPGSQFRVARAGAAAVFAATCVVAPASAQEARVITACAGPNGQLRVVDSAADCRKSEWPLQWNVIGPQGLQGERGEKGDAGEQGPQGAAGPGFSGNQFYTVGIGDLRPIAGTSPLFFLNAPPGGVFTTNPETRLFAAVHLPQGARLEGLTLNGVDSSPPAAVRAELVAIRMAPAPGEMPQVMGTAQSMAGFAQGIFSAPAPVVAVVDNATWHYFLQVTSISDMSGMPAGWPGSLLQVLGVVVHYRLD